MKNIVNSIRGLTAVVLMGAAAAAQGQATADAERCASIADNADLAIQHCTRAIDSRQFSGEPLARLHFNRGTKWAAKSDFNRAIADYDAAIKLQPRFVDAYYNRGNAWANQGDPDRAIADYGAAIKLDPKEAAAYGGRAVEWAVKGDYARAIGDYDAAIKLDPKSSTTFLGRGRARFYSGDFQRSASDIEQAMKLEPNHYTALWLYLARKRSGGINAEEMLDSDTRQDRGGWPAPVIVLYLGRTDVASVMAAATDRDPKQQLEQLCEANFYVAQWHLLRGERERALPLLKDAQGGCPRDFLEHEGAAAELRRLTSSPK